jgi:hypothetical protein
MAQGIGDRVRERIRRLNPNPVEGEWVRGLRHNRERVEMRALRHTITKGAFIRSHGREAFNRIPRSDHIKRGRRVYIAASTATDYSA